MLATTPSFSPRGATRFSPTSIQMSPIRVNRRPPVGVPAGVSDEVAECEYCGRRDSNFHRVPLVHRATGFRAVKALCVPCLFMPGETVSSRVLWRAWRLDVAAFARADELAAHRGKRAG
jgi:hypothetical protein